MIVFPQPSCHNRLKSLNSFSVSLLVKRAFDRGFIDQHWLGFEHFQQDLQWALKRPGEPRHPQDNQFTLFGDTIDELSHWYGFSEKFLADREGRLKQAEAEPAESQPYRNLLRGGESKRSLSLWQQQEVQALLPGSMKWPCGARSGIDRAVCMISNRWAVLAISSCIAFSAMGD